MRANVIGRTALVLASVPIGALLVYSAELLDRVVNQRATHIGLDVIQICYVCAVTGLVGAAIALWRCRATRTERAVARFVAALAVLAAGGYCALHWSGAIVSYDSLFADR